MRWAAAEPGATLILVAEPMVYAVPPADTEAGAGTIWPSGRGAPAAAGAAEAPMPANPAAATRAREPRSRANVLRCLCLTSGSLPRGRATVGAEQPNTSHGTG